jgi:hypothetical protein
MSEENDAQVASIYEVCNIIDDEWRLRELLLMMFDEITTRQRFRQSEFSSFIFDFPSQL